jgi:glucosamine-6-phosphate deaminase
MGKTKPPRPGGAGRRATNFQSPDYLRIPAAELGSNQPVKVRIKGGQRSLARDLALAMFTEICDGESSGLGATLIVPVGPIDQFPILVRMINAHQLSCRNAVFINMDEYLTDDARWIDLDHPLSFRGFMNRAFYDLLDPVLAPPPRRRVFPDPRDPASIAKLIDSRGGVDACFGGVGINGHLAFNEPPEPGAGMTAAGFAALPTRVLTLSRETRAINSVTVGGEIDMIPNRAITVGMREILAARRVRIYCNRAWQSGVVRRALHGPLTADCPASLLRTHADATITLADYVAEPPDIQLR